MTGSQRSQTTARLLVVLLTLALASCAHEAVESTPNAASAPERVSSRQLPLAELQAQSLAPAQTTAGAELGIAVSLDEQRALLGAHRAGTAGAAYVFARQGSSWSEEAKLEPSNGGTGDGFGYAVAIRGDVAAVGAYNHQGRGAVYLFTRDSQGWKESRILTAPSGTSGDRFGWSVALHGRRLLIGAPGYSATHPKQGAVFAYQRAVGGTWAFEGSFSAQDGAAFDGFGSSLALDGDTALVGARRADTTAAVDSGAVYVFTFGVTWKEQARLLPKDVAAGDEVGHAVALEGDTALISAHLHDAKGQQSGAAYVFSRGSDESWSQTHKLVAQDGAKGDGFGFSLGLAQGIAAIGAPWRDAGNAADRGAVYLFEDKGGWTEVQILADASGEGGDELGAALSTRGGRVLVGAYLDDGAGKDAGEVLLYSASELGETCSKEAACLSGHCIDGVCCDSACGGGDTSDCEACSVAAGAVQNGTCGPVAGCGGDGGPSEDASATDGPVERDAKTQADSGGGSSSGGCGCLVAGHEAKTSLGLVAALLLLGLALRRRR